MFTNEDRAKLPKAMLSIDEWTHRWGGSRAALYKRLKSGELEYIKVGRRTFITEAATQKWLASLSK